MKRNTDRPDLLPPVIGLSGGIGTGKSTVAAMFTSLGATLVDADAIVHELQAPGTEVLQQIANKFGSSTLTSDGSLDRKALGAIVFRDAEARLELGKIVHPPVRIEMLAQVTKALHEGASLVIIDIPLLFETNQGRSDPALKIQSTILVYANQSQQIERQILRDGADRDEAVRRIKSQMPIEEKVKLADFTINNSGTIKSTRAQVKKIFFQITRAEKERV